MAVDELDVVVVVDVRELVGVTDVVVAAGPRRVELGELVLLVMFVPG
jgi:hypothetical protein